MAIIRWTPGGVGIRSPWTELERLRDQIEGIFDSMTGSPERRSLAGAGVFPLINLSEDADNLYLTAELPGVSADALEMSIENENLTFRGERKISEAEENVNYHRREREAGFFRRVISLPARVDAEKVQATTKNGVLQVTLPKAAEAKPRQIAIKSE